MVPKAALKADAAAAATIKVYFHVVQKDSTLSGGNIPDSMIADQIDVLNEDYASTGLSFVLANTTRTTNSQWFNQVGPSSSYQTQMKQQVSIAQSYSGMPAISSRYSSAPARRRS